MASRLFKQLLPIILSLLKQDYSASQISRKIGIPKPTLSNWLKQMEAQEMIELEFRTTFKKYKVKQTSIGNGLTPKKPDKAFRRHNVSYKFPILKNKPLIYGKEWSASGVKFSQFNLKGNTILKVIGKRKCSLIIFPRPIYGFSPSRLEHSAKKEALRCSNFLSEKFGIVLGEPIRNRKIHLAVEDNFSKALNKKGITVSLDKADFDDSPPCKKGGEIDFKDSKLAEDYLAVPNKLDNLNSKIDSMQALLQGSVNINQRINQLISVMASQQEQINNLLKIIGGKKNE